jgi:hypothetical protein
MGARPPRSPHPRAYLLQLTDAGTAACSTEGGDTLTVIGSNLFAVRCRGAARRSTDPCLSPLCAQPLSVVVGGVECTGLQRVGADGSAVTCLLPPGTGSAVVGRLPCGGGSQALTLHRCRLSARARA